MMRTKLFQPQNNKRIGETEGCSLKMRSRGRVMLERVKYMYGGLIQFEVLYEGFGSYTMHFFSLLSLNVSSFI